MTQAHANTIAGVVKWLGTTSLTDLVSADEIYGIELPEAVTKDMAEGPRRAVVVCQSGRVPGPGDNGYAPIGRPRFDVKCYGRTPMDALGVYYMVEAVMKELRRTTVEMPDETGVVLNNATHSAGPINLKDAAGQWPVALGVWGISALEIAPTLTAAGGFDSGFDSGFEGGGGP